MTNEAATPKKMAHCNGTISVAARVANISQRARALVREIILISQI